MEKYASHKTAIIRWSVYTFITKKDFKTKILLLKIKRTFYNKRAHSSRFINYKYIYANYKPQNIWSKKWQKEREIDDTTIIKTSNSSLSIMDGTTKKIKDRIDFSNTTKQLHNRDIRKTHYQQ